MGYSPVAVLAESLDKQIGEVLDVSIFTSSN